MKSSVIQPTIFPTAKIAAGFSTRHGGKGKDHLSTMNLSYSVSTDRDTVDQNRAILFGLFGFETDDLATVGQVHGTDVLLVNEAGFYPEHDGLVTTTPSVMLCITAADCAAVLLADSDNNVVGACHAGWRGAAGNIVSKTVMLMEKEGADREKISAFVSPCISVDKFEVGEEVAANFENQYVDRSRSKPHVDLKKHLHDELLQAGVHDTHIEISSHCTYQDCETFFSHRAHKGKTGRMMGFVAIRKQSYVK